MTRTNFRYDFTELIIDGLTVQHVLHAKTIDVVVVHLRFLMLSGHNIVTIVANLNNNA